MTIERWTDERLDALASATQNLLAAVEAQSRTSESQQSAIESQQSAIERLIEGQLGLQAQMGIIAEQTLQLKRAVDYLLSRDGETGPSAL